MKCANHIRWGGRRGVGRQDGSVLIEVLVAILIFSFGVLGLVGLQGAMVRSQTDAKFRVDAAFLAEQFVGLASTDQVNWASYVTSPTSACTSGACADWVRKVKSGLPNGKATVVYTAGTGGGVYSITLTWTMPDGTQHQFVSATSVYK